MGKTMSRYAQHKRDVNKTSDDLLSSCQQHYAQHDATADLRSFIACAGTGTVGPGGAAADVAVRVVLLLSHCLVAAMRR